jgi:hypothetical protein
MRLGFKCHSCKGLIPVARIGEPIKMHWKWKDKTHMTKVHVCKPCWDRARSLKYTPIERK